MLSRASRLVVLLVPAVLLASTVTSAPVAAQPTAQKYSITIKYVKASDEAVGTAKNVGGTYVLTLERRETKRDSWQTLAQSDPQQGTKKARVANVVHSPGFDLSGQWRTCVVRNIYADNEKKTCGKGLLIR